MNHWPLGFRPIFRSLVMADGWARRRGGASPTAAEPWPEALITLAETCAAGQDIGAETWQAALGMMTPLSAQDQIFVPLILATPILLINANAYGHRRLALKEWGETLGLGPSTLAALDVYFQLLGQGTALSLGEHCPWETPAQQLPDFADLWALVTSLPGQWTAPLTLAQRWGWPGTALALLAVLATIQAGPGGIPCPAVAYLTMDYPMNNGEQSLGPRWRGYGVTDLDALADALHRRWAGAPPAHQ